MATMKFTLIAAVFCHYPKTEFHLAILQLAYLLCRKRKGSATQGLMVVEPAVLLVIHHKRN